MNYFCLVLIACLVGFASASDSVFLVNSANSTLTTTLANTNYPILGFTTVIPVHGLLISLALPSGNVSLNEKTRVFASAQICYTAASVGYNFLTITVNGFNSPGSIAVSTSQGPNCLFTNGLFDLAFSGPGSAADVLAPEFASTTAGQVFTIFVASFMVYDEAGIGPM